MVRARAHSHPRRSHCPRYNRQLPPTSTPSVPSPDCPAGESIPIRLFLSGFEGLTPTFKNVNDKFSVKYFLNLVLVDEEERRYFKQQARSSPKRRFTAVGSPAEPDFAQEIQLNRRA